MADYLISRFESGQISIMHEKYLENGVPNKELEKELKNLGLPKNVSRFDLAMKLEEIESERRSRGI